MLARGEDNPPERHHSFFDRLATPAVRDLVPAILLAAVRRFHAQWRKPKIQSKRMIGIGIPINQSNIPLPISVLLSGGSELTPLANSATTP